MQKEFDKVDKILTPLSNVYQGHQKASILLNLGCYKNIVGKESDAFSHFDQSLKILNNSDDPISLAIAHNNKAVIELKIQKDNQKYNEAFKYSRSAVMLVEPLIFAKLKNSDESQLKNEPEFIQHLQVLLVSYYNLGITQVRMKNLKYAKTVFDHGFKMSKKLLGKDSSFAIKFESKIKQ